MMQNYLAGLWAPADSPRQNDNSKWHKSHHQIDRDMTAITKCTVKCKVLHLGSKNSKQDYALQRKNIQKTEAKNDLDIIIDKDLGPYSSCLFAYARTLCTITFRLVYESK